jgi:hypothetical protein
MPDGDLPDLPVQLPESTEENRGLDQLIEAIRGNANQHWNLKADEADRFVVTIRHRTAPGRHLQIRHSQTDAVLFEVTDAGVTKGVDQGVEPSGTIKAYDGDPANVPPGWTIAYQGYFLLGASSAPTGTGSSFRVGTVGGAAGFPHVHYHEHRHNFGWRHSHGGSTGGNQSSSAGVPTGSSHNVADNVDHDHTIYESGYDTSETGGAVNTTVDQNPNRYTLGVSAVTSAGVTPTPLPALSGLPPFVAVWWIRKD